MLSSPVVEHIVLFKVKDDTDPSKVNDLTSLGLTLHLSAGPLRTRSFLFAFSHRVNAAAISESLQMSIDFARLVLHTLASVLHLESDPLVRPVGVDVHDLVLFLHIQSYKKLLPRKHKDSTAIADVWPSTSAFDGYLSALSGLQVMVNRVVCICFRMILVMGMHILGPARRC